MKVEPPLPSSGSRCRFVPFVWVTDSIDSINPPQLGRNKTGWGEENALRAQLDIFSTKFFFPKIGNVRRIDGNVACKCVGFPCEGMVTSPLPWPPEWIQHVTRSPPLLSRWKRVKAIEWRFPLSSTKFMCRIVWNLGFVVDLGRTPFCRSTGRVPTRFA